MDGSGDGLAAEGMAMMVTGRRRRRKIVSNQRETRTDLMERVMRAS
jgi:hypothetical protein